MKRIFFFFLFIPLIPAAAQVTDSINHGIFTDPRDGQEYKWMKIGDQTWMVENLAYLPAVSGPSNGSDSLPYYYVYAYEGTETSEAKTTENYTKYGVLYNWAAAKFSCPEGWHLPSDSSWSVLEDYLVDRNFGFGGSGKDIGKSMSSNSGWRTSKETGTIGHDQANNNATGFNATPAGYCNQNVSFEGLEGYVMFWSSSEENASHTWIRMLGYLFDPLFRNHQTKRTGISVRCLKD